MTLDLIGQIIGFSTIALSIIIFQQTKRERLLALKLTSDVLWTTHYAMIGSYSGAATSFLCISREIIFYNRVKHKWANSKIWLFAYIAVYICSAVLTWKNISSIFPACASTLATIGFWQKNPVLTKRISIPASLCMVAYDIFNGSWAGLVNEALTLGSIAVSFIRRRRSEKAASER